MATKPAEIRRQMERPAWNAFIMAYIAQRKVASLKWEQSALEGGKYQIECEIEVDSGYMAGFRMVCPSSAVDHSIRNPATAAIIGSQLIAFSLCGDGDCGNLGAYFEFAEEDDEKVRRLRYVLSGLGGSSPPEYSFFQTLPERASA